ncbi:hypothetical protein [Enterococcus italicus]|uniref:hypothetical protein n=1 Tax=Enterococcus italicus TaxID=246144 RepID=UPI0028A7D923|nr:hypothetical protein [Enterococcus italicus]
MKKDEIIEKIKELANEGNVEKAKLFLEEHKDSLGDYYDKAKAALESNSGVKGLLNKVKGFFN